MTNIISKGSDGYYHPATEEQLQSLVAHAYDKRIPLRVRGSQHSVIQAIYTTGFDGQGAPPADTITIMLDKYRQVTITPDANDPTHALVEVEAGCNLGKNPYDPTGTSTWENSLNYLLQTGVDGNKYALSDLGGISHQTVSGFFSTGSSGGSTQYSVYDDIVRIRFIDGTGELHDVSRDAEDPRARDLFFAAGISLGLLGVISKVWLRAGPAYNIKGTQTTTATSDAPIDLFGDRPDQPSLESYLQQTQYTRLMWWPQRSFERIQVWQCERLEPAPGFVPKPYEELGTTPQINALAGSLFYTLIGNLDDIAAVPPKLDNWYRHLDGTLSGQNDSNVCTPLPSSRDRRARSVDEVLAFLQKAILQGLRAHPGLTPGSDIHTRATQLATAIKAPTLANEDSLPDWLAGLITLAIKLLLDNALSTPQAQQFASYFQTVLPGILPGLLAIFVPLEPVDAPQQFQDTWLCGLPMDNQMDDQLWPTAFTELWIPIDRATEVMQTLKTFYEGGGDATVSFERTGTFSCELYAAKNSPFWMSPSYGADVYRVDVFWFELNAADPTKTFYPPFWELLKPFTFKPHWGKDLPPPSADWLAYYKQGFPMLERFLQLRAQLDPAQIFVSDYWREHFGIEKPSAP
ncbi:D-arabinono-1,4-lactone oxidase [Chondromyces crocatus]|uniref:FAD-binding PCMH-type domain-containing protein n=1 Tax=Chondromyces crocatus TaxID=52 RepID=A0A0K1EBV1_CHOCO|nr:D-arabinono-1,4-lactone oxidase [Chondromyces crocatus]AKT38053.1 uncharacterized protein CMC5_021940 [Chondromyces crocatus]